MLENIRGGLSSALKEKSPEYALAMEKSKNFIDKESLLKGLTNPLNAETRTLSLATKSGREAAREAAKELAPNSYQGIEDIIHAKSFESPGSWWKGWFNPKRLATRAMLGLGGAGASVATGERDPYAIAAMAASAGALSSPVVAKTILGTGSRLLGSPWSIRGLQMQPLSDALVTGMARAPLRLPPELALHYPTALLPDEEK
jgi:hypothetical protein